MARTSRRIKIARVAAEVLILWLVLPLVIAVALPSWRDRGDDDVLSPAAIVVIGGLIVYGAAPWFSLQERT